MFSSPRRADGVLKDVFDVWIGGGRIVHCTQRVEGDNKGKMLKSQKRVHRSVF